MAPNEATQQRDKNLIVGTTLLSVVTMLVCSYIFQMTVLLQYVILVSWCAVVIKTIWAPISTTDAPVDVFADIEDYKRLDLIYVLKNINIFDPDADSRYMAFVRKYLNDRYPQDVSEISSLLMQLDLKNKLAAEERYYRNKNYSISMSLVTVGALATASNIMFLVAAEAHVVSLLGGVVLLAIGVYSSLSLTKSKMNSIGLLLGTVIVCGIIGGILMQQ